MLDRVDTESAVLAKPGVVDEDVNGKARSLGGIVDLLRRVGIVEVGGDDPNLRRVMDAVKARFDPNGVLPALP